MEVIAHRGASGSAPENTRLAFRLAWQLGADGIELDVHLSRDRCLMVHHDADTQRFAKINLSIAETDSAVLRKLDVGRWRGAQFAGAQMPLLQEVLDETPAGKRVLIELKTGPQIVPALGLILTNHPNCARLRINLISFQLDTLIACRQALPDWPCYAVFSTQDDDHPNSHQTLQRWIECAQHHGLAGLDPDYRDLTPEFAAAARAAGLELLTWTVNDPRHVPHLVSLGVAALTTDWPEQLRRALAQEE